METIMAIKINGRQANAPIVQDILTKYGCIIRTRIGLHKTSEFECSTDGILIIHLVGKESEIDSLSQELENLDGVHTTTIEF